MAENSSIEWTDHTWNPWIGCQKVSPACDHCYAERDTPARVLRARGVETWGAHGQRVRTSKTNWKLPKRWNSRAAVAAAGWADGVKLYGSEEAAIAAGHLKPRRPRVFSLSQGDWLDNAVPVEWLADMLDVVRKAPALDWLLLTKRMGAWHHRVVAALALAATTEGRTRWPALAEWLADWINGRSPAHVWVGSTVCTQEEADRDIPKLLATPAAVRFLSVEPMLGPIDLHDHLVRQVNGFTESLHWVICGGESGPHARPMHPEWVRGLRDQCASAGVPFLFKQWGEWIDHDQPGVDRLGSESSALHRWHDGSYSVRVGKKAAGRLLDGAQHDGFPEAARCTA